MMTQTVERPVYDTRVTPRDYYCQKCAGFLLASSATDGRSRVKCHRCKAWRVIEHNPFQATERKPI
jgi:phage FluMu protein Com